MSARHAANLLTGTRLVLSPILFWVLLEAEEQRGVSWAAFALGVVVAITDFFDGWAARRSAVVSGSGAFLDPLADKVVILGSGFCLVAVERYWWLPMTLIAVREFAITVWRTHWARDGVAIPARRSAKYKTCVQGAALTLAVCPPLATADAAVTIALWAAVVFTLVSGFQYLSDGAAAVTAQRTRSA